MNLSDGKITVEVDGFNLIDSLPYKLGKSPDPYDGFRGTAEDMAAHKARREVRIGTIGATSNLRLAECFECKAKDKEIAVLSNAHDEQMYEMSLDMKEMEKEIEVLRGRLLSAQKEVEDHKFVTDKLHADSVELQNLKASRLLQASSKIENDYFMLEGGKLPILWINAANEDIFPSESFVRVANRIKRINPDIDLIILTYGVDNLQQMDDEGLNSLGLYRK